MENWKIEVTTGESFVGEDIENFIKDKMQDSAKDLINGALDQYEAKVGPIIKNLNEELTAANKAIVDLAWELEKFIDKVDRGEARSVESYGEMKEALKTHAPAIEKARGE